ncbi:DUF2723 domain-containing protein, partial [bacterium]|nr:DUF2723 domain-containing protein [candidate division CSSED10-310 bacterium]
MRDDGMRLKYICAAAALLVPLIIYWAASAPGVTIVDSGELALAVHQWSIAHPPGFPLYTMVAHIWSRLPFASTARAANLFSGLCAAAAALLMWLAVVAWLEEWAPASRRRNVYLIALSVSLALGFTFVVWGFATTTEVYGLNQLCLAGALWCCLRVRRGARPQVWLLAAAAFLGCGMAVHHVTVILAIPGLLLLTAANPAARKPIPLLIAGGTALAIATILYATIPWRSGLHPLFNWGRADDLQRLWWHLSGKQYRAFLAAGSPSALLARAGRESIRLGSAL